MKDVLRNPRPNEFVLSRLKAQARANLKVDAAKSYTVLGVIACLSRDEKEMRANHARALKLAPNDLVGRINFATSLWKLGFLGESYQVLSKLFDDIPDDRHVLDSMIRQSMLFGQWERFVALLSEWDSRNPDEPHLNSGILSVIESHLQTGFDTEATGRMIEETMALLRDQGICPVDTALACCGDEVVCRVFIDRPVETIVELNEQLREFLIEREFTPSVTRHLSILCFPYPIAAP